MLITAVARPSAAPPRRCGRCRWRSRPASSRPRRRTPSTASAIALVVGQHHHPVEPAAPARAAIQTCSIIGRPASGMQRLAGQAGRAVAGRDRADDPRGERAAPVCSGFGGVHGSIYIAAAGGESIEREERTERCATFARSCRGQGSPSRALGIGGAALAALALAVAAERGGWLRASVGSRAGGDATPRLRIWLDDDPRARRAARVLRGARARAGDGAAAGDADGAGRQEYVLWLNGAGSARGGTARAADSTATRSRSGLAPGTNRIVARAAQRDRRGRRLDPARRRRRVALWPKPARWRIYRSAWRGAARG